MPALKFNSDGTPHIHIYVRAEKTYQKKDPDRYKCDHPMCSHWAYRKDIKGKASICAICREKQIILSYESLLLSKPRCLDCSNTKKAKQTRALTSVIANVLNEEGNL